jgi:hypothetical protein
MWSSVGIGIARWYCPALTIRAWESPSIEASINGEAPPPDAGRRGFAIAWWGIGILG